MKSGTTSIHQMLTKHPSIYFLPGEQKFFTIDDIREQKQFFPYVNEKWTYHLRRKNYDLYKEWYLSFLLGYENEKWVGEDTPSYLSSKKAPRRINEMFPDAKIIITLRDPIDRAWSHYWHKVNNFSAFLSFEETLRYSPGLIFERSFYKHQVEVYLNRFGKENVKIILFEELVSNPKQIFNELCDFLSLEKKQIELRHSNKGTKPKFLGLRLLRNFFFKHLNGMHYFDFLPEMPNKPTLSYFQKAILKIEKIANKSGSKYTMKKETENFLKEVFLEENFGLEKLIDKDLSKYWKTFK
jgi:hypothetical protein